MVGKENEAGLVYKQNKTIKESSTTIQCLAVTSLLFPHRPYRDYL